MMETKSKSIIHRWHEKIEKLIVKYRNRSLLIAAIIGVGLAFFIYYAFSKLNGSVLHSSITILFLGLPTFYVLWKFRTHDVQRQIDKTEENTNNSTFFECARMLTEVKSAEGKPTKYDSLSKKIALEQLAYLKKETGFDKNRIDSLTRGLGLGGKNFNLARFNGLDLSKAYLGRAELNGAELNGANLSGANLTGAILDGAISPHVPSNRPGSNIATNLTGAKLNGADLTEAKLNKAILIDAELIGAKLVGAKLNEANLTGANLTKADLNDATLFGAIYDDETEFNDTILEKKEMRNKAGMEHNADL